MQKPISQLTLHETSRALAGRVAPAVLSRLAVPEGDSLKGALCRRLVAAMAQEFGQAWLGSLVGTDNILRLWDGGHVEEHSAHFVLPVYDSELERLIQEEKMDPEAIAACLVRGGGELLFWD
jgi:hypothetical protein